MGLTGVILAAVAGFAYGAVHYMTLSKPWMKAAGIPMGPDGKPAGNRSPLPFVLSGVAMLVVAGFMRHIFAGSGIATPGAGLIAGAGIGLFLISPWIMINNGYTSRPFLLTVIDGAYATIGCGLMGLVLTLV